MDKLSSLTRKFNPGEKMLWFIFSTILVVSGIMLVIKVNNLFTVEVPGKGGVLREGMLGSPRFINPVLAIGDADKSISELVYSGLFKPTPDGSYKPDLAESFTVSEDGLVYDVIIKANASFQDGTPVTSDDIIFTITKVVDPVIKSPKASSWAGVLVEKVGEKEVRFTLKKPYSSFFENLTLGILPAHIWQDSTSEEFPFSDRNVNPVGSGPYAISEVNKNKSGIPTEIVLKSFKKYTGGTPNISELDLTFYGDEENLVSAFQNKSIGSIGGITPEKAAELARDGAQIYFSRMPRVFAAFFNQNQAPIFANIEVRRALDASLNKEEIAKQITSGYGVPLMGPTPLDIWSTSTNTGVESAKKILADAGWKENADGLLEKKTKTGTQLLKFSISTSDVPDLKRTAEILQRDWQALGAEVDLKIFESGDLNNNILKPRKYDILLFGEVVGRDMDLYPFWHSSERNDPGLNISLYANITADKLLEDIRIAKTSEEKESKMESLQKEIEGDVGAVFLYAPEYIYVVSSEVKNVSLPQLIDAQNRFVTIESWYMKTQKVWAFFAK